MMAPLHVGVLGCGRIAQFKHLTILRAMEGVRIAGLAELDPERRAEARKATPTATAYADYRTLLKEPDIDAVVICLPTPLHAEAAVAAFEAGKHVYLEKPIATTLDEARAVAEAQDQAGTVGMMGLNFRYSPNYEEARRQVRAGALGTLTAVRTVFTTAARSLPGWKQARATGGGVLLDLATHHVDLLRFLLDDEVESVRAQIRSVLSEADNADVTLTMASGLVVQGLFSMTSVEDHRIEIFGQEARLTVDRFRRADVEVIGQSLQDMRRERIQRTLQPRHLLHTPNFNEPFERALQAFVRSIRFGLPASPDLHDGLESLAVVVAAEESARTGEAVRPADVLDSMPSPAPHGA